MGALLGALRASDPVLFNRSELYVPTALLLDIHCYAGQVYRSHASLVLHVTCDMRMDPSMHRV